MISIIPLSGAMLLLYWIRYVIRKRKEQPLAVPVLFTCFFLPKLNLLKVSSISTAGIRIDDFLALGLLILALTDRRTWKNKMIRRGVGMLIVLSAVNLLSVVLSRMRGYDNQILLSVMMVIRKFEYFSFALTGIYIARRLKNPYKTFMEEFTLMSVMHLLPGILQVLGKCTYAVSGAESPDFFQGIAVSTFNGYYEYGMFLCFGCAVFMCDFLKHRSGLSLAMVPVTMVMLVLSESRSALLVGFFLILLAVFLPLRARASRPAMAIGGYGLLAAAGAGLLLLSGLVEIRSLGRFATVSLDSFLAYWKEVLIRWGNLPQYVNMVRTGYFEFDAIDDLGYLHKIADWSAATRFLKWGAALDGLRMYPLLGYGTGLTHVMDGNYFKLLGETGLLGTGLWLGFYGYFMHAVYKLRRQTRIGKALFLMMAGILINSLFLDMFEASKPMELLWMVVGGAIAGNVGDGSVVPHSCNEQNRNQRRPHCGLRPCSR